jgi:Zinc-finger of C2H2 type
LLHHISSCPHTSLPNFQVPVHQAVTCRTYNRQFENEKALSIYVQNSTGHDNVGKTEDLPYRPQRAPYRGPATFNGDYKERVQPWCSVCDREFYSEFGFQMHINTSYPVVVVAGGGAEIVVEVVGGAKVVVVIAAGVGVVVVTAVGGLSGSLSGHGLSS